VGENLFLYYTLWTRYRWNGISTRRSIL